MHDDLERLLRRLTPALALLTACEPAPEDTKTRDAAKSERASAAEDPAAGDEEVQPQAPPAAADATPPEPKPPEPKPPEPKPPVEVDQPIEPKPPVEPKPVTKLDPSKPTPPEPSLHPLDAIAEPIPRCPKGEHCPGGRPLLDASGQPVTAPLVPGESEGRHVKPLQGPTWARAEAARAWLADAATEHASVASFGRVALELLTLGAPLDLVEDAHRAAIDEAEHTRICLALARACGADPVEPGALPRVPQRAPDLARFAADTFIEGCVGETIAALAVTRAAAGAHSSIRPLLERIADDEADHAALAWRMVAWAVNRGGAPVLESVRAAAHRARSQHDGGAAAADPNSDLRPLGRLDTGSLDMARRDAWQHLLEPMLAMLEHRVPLRPTA